MAEPASADAQAKERVSADHMIAALQSQRNQAQNALAVAEGRMAALKAEVATLQGQLADANKKLADRDGDKKPGKPEGTAPPVPKVKPRAPVKRVK